ncbi:hypothetical protein GALMADRAFT_222241 [Galerina marginata CBS 339.88]|uniref:F-box domain-containing protein n=1 Tax=Galerina marginata (strain CBS 339.88) TaxID=685588 RepID=A0A067TE64_GALM3|nr:hypothetical protein GALMADRAFT_222241 [Galerina marginata CBS 339.88]
MASSDKLCAELYDHIIDFLHDDHATLRSCALVCRSWVPSSRGHLFYDLKLSGNGSPTKTQGSACHRIFRTILSSPHIASYVKKLSIVESNVTRPWTYRWVCEEITFPSLLKKLACLRVLEFNFPPSLDINKPTTWSPMVSEDITEAMSSLTLNSFTFRQFLFASFSDFVKTVFCCRHLKTLQLDHVDLTTAISFSPSALDSVLTSLLKDTSPKKASVEKFLLRSNTAYLIIPVLLHRLSCLDFTGLRSLLINISPDGYVNVVQLLQGTPALESLELEIDQDFDYDVHLGHSDIIDMTLLPSLKSLSFQCSFLLGRIEPIPWLSTTLRTLELSNTLEDLSLTFTVDKPPPNLTIQAFDHNLHKWRNLDTLLTGPAFTLMRRVRLDFALDNPVGDESVKFISQEFVKQLQGLRDKGVLEMDFYELR